MDEGRSFAAVARKLFEAAPAAPQVGRYYLLERIGQGGMGVVYLGYDPSLERRVAIKFLRDRHRGGDRLREEGKALANLEHPNVVSVHEVGESNDGVYLVMAHIEGQTFDTWLAEGPRPWREVLRVMVDAGRGLEAVHRAGLAHRDVKPSNLLIDEAGQVRVADFGLAVRVEPGKRGVAVAGGTEAYMAPEQEDGGLVGPAADQYAWCVCLLEALTGARDRSGGVEGWRRRSVQRDVAGDAPPTYVFAALMRGLQCEPADRYPSMGALLAELRLREESRRPLWLGIGLCVGLAGLGVGYVIAPHPVAVSENPCAAQQGEASRSFWTDERRDAVRDAAPDRFDDPLWSRSFDDLDGLARAWDQASIEACELHRVGRISEAALDDRSRCLQRQGREFGLLVALLAGPEKVTAMTARGAIASLERPESCEVPSALLRPGGGQIHDADSPEGRLEHEVADAWSRYHLGLREGLDVSSFEARAWAQEDRALRADTARLLAELTVDVEEKYRLSDLAVRSAIEGRAPVMLTAALLDQGRIREWLGDLDGADERFAMADAAAHALDQLSADFPSLGDSTNRLRGQLELARGNLARRRGAYREGLAHQLGAISQFEAATVRQPLAEARAWINVGEAHRLLGEYDDADRAYTRGIQLAQPLLLEHDATLEAMLANRGASRQDAGDWVGAEEDYSAIYEPYAKPLRGGQAVAAFNLALMAEVRGDLAAATKHCHLAASAVGPEGVAPTPAMAALFSLHCLALEHELGLREVSVESFERMYAEVETYALGDSSFLVLGQLRIARSMLLAQRWSQARRWIDTARKTASAPGSSNTLDLAAVNHLSGRWEMAQGNRDAALAEQRRAVSVFEDGGVDQHPALVDALLALGALEPDLGAAGRALERAGQLIEKHGMHKTKRQRWLGVRAARGRDE